MILLDTSVWIEVFRRPSSIQLRDVAEIDEIVTCLPIVQEVLQGFRDERAFHIAHEAMGALPTVEAPLPAVRFLEAAGLYRTARRAGITVRSGVDCLIAACALRHRLTVVHRDRDFELLARICPLSARNV